jgi:hypothetical protein
MGVSFTVREKQKHWLFENKMLGKIFGPKRNLMIYTEHLALLIRGDRNGLIKMSNGWIWC